MTPLLPLRERTPRQLIVLLGVAGVLPMVACLVMAEAEHSLLIFKTYSVSIIAFLSGIWWSTALMTRDLSARMRVEVLLMSNAIVLVAVGAVIFLDDHSLLVLGLLYVFLLLGEGSHIAFRKQPHYYSRMRQGVTLLVLALHLAAYGILL